MWRMLQHLKVHMVEDFSGMGGSVHMGVIVQYCDTF
jgi:hypothetical protein